MIQIGVEKDGVYRLVLARYNPLVEEGRARRWYLTRRKLNRVNRRKNGIRQENVRLEERTRIAQELHDTLLQTVQSASLHLGAAVFRVSPDSPVKNQLDRTLKIMRHGIVEAAKRDTGPSLAGLSNLNLVGALSRMQDELKVQPDIDFRVTVTGRLKPLAREISMRFTASAESLVNAFCHSGAKRIELELNIATVSSTCGFATQCGIDPQMLEKGRDGHWGCRHAGTDNENRGVLKILSSPAAVRRSNCSSQPALLQSSHSSSQPG